MGKLSFKANWCLGMGITGIRFKTNPNLWHLVAIAISLLFFSSPSWGETKADLVEREGVYFKKFSNVPFSGKVSGQWQGQFLDGKKEGEWITYHDNGQLESKGSFIDGNKDGDWVFFFDNGTIATQLNYKLGKKNGDFVGLYPNGCPQIKGSYLDDEINGIVFWFDNDTTLNIDISGSYSDGKKIAELSEGKRLLGILEAYMPPASCS